MTTFDNICDLGSFRDCRDEVVSRKIIGKILEAGRQAPSPGNVQSLSFIVVEDDHKKETLSEVSGDHRMEEAPTLIIIVGDIERMARRVGEDRCRDSCNVEAACAAQNMRLTAAEEDVSSCWVTGLDEPRVSEIFGIPEGKTPLGVVALGYTDQKVEKPTKFGMNQVCFYDEYDNQINSVFDDFEFKGLVKSRKAVEKRSKAFTDKVRRFLKKHL